MDTTEWFALVLYLGIGCLIATLCAIAIIDTIQYHENKKECMADITKYDGLSNLNTYCQKLACVSKYRDLAVMELNSLASCKVIYNTTIN